MGNQYPGFFRLINSIDCDYCIKVIPDSEKILENQLLVNKYRQQKSALDFVHERRKRTQEKA